MLIRKLNDGNFVFFEDGSARRPKEHYHAPLKLRLTRPLDYLLGVKKVAHPEWCGKPCGECSSPCALDESMPCSPDCPNLNSKTGDPDSLECDHCEAIHDEEENAMPKPLITTQMEIYHVQFEKHCRGIDEIEDLYVVARNKDEAFFVARRALEDVSDDPNDWDFESDLPGYFYEEGREALEDFDWGDWYVTVVDISELGDIELVNDKPVEGYCITEGEKNELLGIKPTTLHALLVAYPSKEYKEIPEPLISLLIEWLKPL